MRSGALRKPCRWGGVTFNDKLAPASRLSNFDSWYESFN